jgi:hypothetical protein
VFWDSCIEFFLKRFPEFVVFPWYSFKAVCCVLPLLILVEVAMHELQNYRQEELIYNGKSYVFSSTYYDG